MRFTFEMDFNRTRVRFIYDMKTVRAFKFLLVVIELNLDTFGGIH
jgi:hypothetical protein